MRGEREGRRLSISRTHWIPLGLLIVIACSALHEPSPQESRSLPEPALHAVHSEELSDVMRRLQLLRRERFPREMDLRAERRTRVSSLAGIAREMARSAAAIPDALEGVEMTEEGRRDFLRLSIALQESSEGLARDAEKLSPAELETRVRDLDTICAQCHSRFRILPLTP